MTATILTLPHYFPGVFVFRVCLSVFLLGVLLFLSQLLYKKSIVNKLQRNTMMVLSTYVMLMLYHTVIGRYSQTYYRYDGEIFSMFKALAENFTVTGFSQLVINLLMMIPVSFMLMIILKVEYRTLWAFDITVALVLFIELLQFFTRAGTLQLDDIITNTIGAIIGILFYYFIKAIYKKKKE